MASYDQVERDVDELVAYGGQYERILLLPEGHNILATGVGKYNGDICLEFNSFHVRDFFKRRAFKVFCRNSGLKMLKPWRTSECTTLRAALPQEAKLATPLLKAYFETVHGIKGSDVLRIHKRAWAPSNQAFKSDT